MTKLISGRVAKVPSANVSTDRYDFIDLAETEPDLGLPPGSGYVLTSTIQGVRSWLNPVEFSGVANVSIFSGRANVATLADFANVANVVTTLSNFTTANLVEGINLYFTNARVVSALTAGNQIIIEANGRISANVAAVPLDAAAVNAIVQPFLTTANVIETSGNLYFTNSRVVSALVAGDQIIIEANGRISANISVAPLDAAAVNAIVQPFLTTANVIETSGNLYFTTARARSVFTAGKGIAIQENGVIKNTSASYDYSLNYNGTEYGNVSSTLSNILVLPGIPTTDRFLLKSLLVTNLYNDTVYVSGNILYGTGNTATFANRIPISEGGATEFMSDAPQILNPYDIVKLQGFNSNGTPTSNIINYIITYETLDNSIDYSGTGITVPTADTSMQIYHADSTYAIFESIKLVNLTTGIVKVKLWWADANNNPLAFYVYNFPVPENASVELLQTPKRINSTNKLFVSYTGTAATNALSVFVSSRIGGVFTVGPQTTSAPSGNVISVAFSGTEPDNTSFYYTIE